MNVIVCSHDRYELLGEIMSVLVKQTVLPRVYVIDDSVNFPFNGDLLHEYPSILEMVTHRPFDGLYHRVSKYNFMLDIVEPPLILLDDDTIAQSEHYIESYEQALKTADVVRGAWLYEGKLNRIPWFSTTNIGVSIPIKFDPMYDGRYGYEDHGMGQELKSQGALIVDGPPETACIHKGKPYAGDRVATKINENYYNKKWGLA